MFKRLRNKFLIINMIIITLTILVAFSTIYITTYRNTYNRNIKSLNLIDESINGKNTMLAINEGEDNIINGTGVIEFAQFVPIISGQNPYFSMMINKNGGIEDLISSVYISEEDTEKTRKLALSEQKNYSVININGTSWMYKIVNVSNSNNMINGDILYNITFIDVSDSSETLVGLLTTFIVVSVVTLIVIFFISLYSANRSIRPISEAFDKQKEFVANASHELKTPLAIINANYDVLIANREETIESQMKWLEYIRIGTNRMTKLITSLLLLARTENYSDKVDKKIFNLSNTIQNSIDMMVSQVLDEGIEVETEIEKGIIINHNEDMINEVFTILYENAIKYTDDKKKIKVGLIHKYKRAELYIKNTTEKIPKEDLPYLFNRFYRLDKSRNNKKGGYGLGLSIAKSILDNIGGKISVDYKDGWIIFKVII